MLLGALGPWSLRCTWDLLKLPSLLPFEKVLPGTGRGTCRGLHFTVCSPGSSRNPDSSSPPLPLRVMVPLGGIPQ